MAEMVYRRRRRRRVRMLDERRFALPVSLGSLRAMLRFAAEAAPGFLLALADVLKMPSYLHAGYIAGLAALGRPVLPSISGVAAAILLRLTSGLDPHWEGLISLGLLYFSPMLLAGCGNAMLLSCTAVSLLPAVIRGWLAPTAMEMILTWGSVAFAVISAPILCCGVKALTDAERDGTPAHIDQLEGRAGAAYLGLMIICGGARMMVLGVNAGMTLAAFAVLQLGMYFGAGAGCAAGILCGMSLYLMGLPMALAAALAAGGYLAGVMKALGRRWLCCLCFAAAALLPVLTTGTQGMGCSAGILIAAMSAMLMPQRVYERMLQFHRRFRSDQPQAGNAYAASILAAWEKTVDAMAMSVPSPVKKEPEHDSVWWSAHLCEGCPEEVCTCRNTDMLAARAESVWQYREADDALWQEALEGLRGLGCMRLYQLRQAMDLLRMEDAARQRNIRQLLEQRGMLVTHLTAMAGAARRFVLLSQGENWWDALMAARIRRALAETASPVRLIWVRRIQGRVQAALSLRDITGARRQARELCELVGMATGVRMTTAAVDGDRVRLSQRPPLEINSGVCTSGVDGQAICGDTAWCGVLQDGRFMASVCDGMGHGEDAALSSQQTVELLRLCLDAGYSLQQTLRAVNGMMLLGDCGERFITVDLLTIDLWSGQAILEKMGAASSWVRQQGILKQLTGDALPLGILESVESGENMLRLSPGDIIILMTDGMEDAFPTRDDLQDAISLALMENEPQHAADSLMQSALIAGNGDRLDDQTVLILRIQAVQDRSDEL